MFRRRARAAAEDAAVDEPGTAVRTAPPPRRPARGRAAAAGATAVGAVGTGILRLARLVMVIGWIVALLIALGILLRDVDANSRNSIVKDIHDAGSFLVGPFKDVITENGKPKLALSINWGIAAVVYLLLAALLSSMIARVGRGGVALARRPAAA